MRLQIALLSLSVTTATAFAHPFAFGSTPQALEGDSNTRAAYRTFKQNQINNKQRIDRPHVLPPLHSNSQQIMSNPGSADLGPAIPDAPHDKETNSGGPDNSQLTISDILPSQRRINIFASLTREITSLTTRLESSLPGDNSNTTLLAPLNSAMDALPRKPWEDRPDDNSGVSAESSEDKAAENLRRFVLEHVVPVSPWLEGKENAVRTLGGEETGSGEGREIWWEKRGGGDDGTTERKVIMPGEVVVDGIVGRVGNGEVWALRGVVNYE